MNALLPICCGLDVHQKFVTACLLSLGASGQVTKEQRAFGTTTAQLRELLAGLQAQGCRRVALESTGVYGKPVHNLLEGAREQVLRIACGLRLGTLALPQASDRTGVAGWPQGGRKGTFTIPGMLNVPFILLGPATGL